MLRELLVLAILAGLALAAAVAVASTEELLRLPLRLPRSHPMKSAIVDPGADTDIVPAEIVEVTDYPHWIDEFDHQVQALVQLAREGNRVAFNIICDLHTKYSSSSDQASAVAAVFERIGRGA